MAIKKMELLNITFPFEKTIDLLKVIKDLEDFYPQDASKLIKGVKDVQVMPENKEYRDLIQSLKQTSTRLNLDLEELDYHDETLSLDQSYDLIKELDERLDQIDQVKEELEKERDENLATKMILENMQGHDVNLDLLFNSHYVKVRIGQVPTSHLQRLQYYEDEPFILKVYNEENGKTWCAYLGLNKDIRAIDNIFSSLDFKRIRVPDFVHGTIQDALDEITNEIHAMNEYIATVEQKRRILKEENRLKLNTIYTVASYMNQLYAMHKYVIDYQYQAGVYGFVAKEKSESLQAKLTEIEGVKILVLPEMMYQDWEIVPPVVLENSLLVEPFEVFSGASHYNDVDYTLPVALLLSLGAGFALSNWIAGIVLTLIGLVFSKKSSAFGVLSRIGVVTLVFGVINKICSMPNFTVRLIISFLFVLVGYYLVMVITQINKNKKENNMIDVWLGIDGVSGLIVLSVIIIAGVVHLYYGESSLYLPLKLIGVIAILLTLFKKSIKKSFLKNKKTA